MDGGAWWATVHGVAKSQTRMSDVTFSCCVRTPSSGMWDPVIEPSAPALGVQSFSHWTTREVPQLTFTTVC